MLKYLAVRQKNSNFATVQRNEGLDKAPHFNLYDIYMIDKNIRIISS